MLRGIVFGDDFIKFHAVNPKYEDIVIPKEEADESLRLIGKMLGIAPRFQRKTTFY